MTQRLVCFHGHEFELTEAISISSVACPLCGTTKTFPSDAEPTGIDPYGATLPVAPPTQELPTDRHYSESDDAPGEHTLTTPAAQPPDDRDSPSGPPTQLFAPSEQRNEAADGDGPEAEPTRDLRPEDFDDDLPEDNLAHRPATSTRRPATVPTRGLTVSIRRSATTPPIQDRPQPADEDASTYNDAGKDGAARETSGSLVCNDNDNDNDNSDKAADGQAGAAADGRAHSDTPETRRPGTAPTRPVTHEKTVSLAGPPTATEDARADKAGDLPRTTEGSEAAGSLQTQPTSPGAPPDTSSPEPKGIAVPGATLFIGKRGRTRVRGGSGSRLREPFATTAVGKPSLPGYEVFEELGRGGMGVVYRARDNNNDRDVALKTLLRMGPSELQRFKYEFRSMSSIYHPNVAMLYELLSDGKTWCFSMEILEGVEFLEFVWSGFAGLQHRRRRSMVEIGPAEPRMTERRVKRLHEALKQLALGLNKLHSEGILHRDVKPSNVMVTTSRRLVVLDFGLAVPIRDEATDAASRGIQGTPEYMSPEQAIGSDLTGESDWYSAGVMLYEVLTGRLPIDAPLGKLLKLKQTFRPTEPRQLTTGIPIELNNLCMALLDPKASNRPNAIDVLRCVDAADLAESMRGMGQAAVRNFKLVGRESQLAVLRRAYEEVSQGAARSIFVRGLSGMGKSELVRRFLAELKTDGAAIILTGRCYEQESVPFKALDNLIDALSVYLCGLDAHLAASLMPVDSAALIRVFPVLGQVPEARRPHGSASIANASQQELRQRALNALRELLVGLSGLQPLVLYIDDFQWGDEDSARLLADLVRPPEAPRMLLIGSYRQENEHDSVCVRALTEEYGRGRRRPHREDLPVEPLSEDDSMRLALMLLGRHDAFHEALAKKIARESGGGPFFVWALAQYAQEDPAIGDQTLELDDVIWKRVMRLGEAERRLLELVAIAGRPMPAGEIFHAGSVVQEGPGLLTELRNNSFVRTTQLQAHESVVETYHDRIRESVVRHLPEATVRERNLRLGESIEQASEFCRDDLKQYLKKTGAFDEPSPTFSLDKRQWQRVFDLAYFYDAAGKHRRALPFALVAAEQARRQNALEVSEQQYRIALRGAEKPDALRFRVLEGLGEVLNLRGDYGPARAHFSEARELARGNVANGRIEGKLGELAFKQGDMKVAMHHLERALRELGRQVPPERRWQVLPYLLHQVIVQTLHSLRPGWFIKRRPMERLSDDLLPIRFYNRLFYPYWFARDEFATLWTQLHGMNLAERYAETPELAHAYSLHAVAMSTLPWFERGIDYAKRGEAISRKSGNLLAQGQAAHFHGVTLFAASQWRATIEKCNEAIGFLERAGDRWEANMARYHIADSLYHLGDLAAAIAQAKQVYATGEELGDKQSMGVITIVWAAASPRDVPVEILQAEFERPREDPLSTVQVLQAQGVKLLLHDDQPGEAAESFARALQLAKARGLKNTYVAWAYAWRTTCLRTEMERAAAGSAERRKWRREAERAARVALRTARKYENDLPHALRENAMLAAEADKAHLARGLFEESLCVAACQEADYQYAKTLVAFGEVGGKFDWHDAHQRQAEGQQRVDELENSEPIGVS